jgi:hypothetical protein
MWLQIYESKMTHTTRKKSKIFIFQTLSDFFLYRTLDPYSESSLKKYECGYLLDMCGYQTLASGNVIKI